MRALRFYLLFLLSISLGFGFLTGCSGGKASVGNSPGSGPDGSVDGSVDGDTPGGDGGSTLTCGDGVVQSSEQCDDGGTVDGDGCSSSCELEPGWDCYDDGCVAAECGDGILAGDEACDDGNRLAGDGCNFSCRREPGYVCVTPGAPCRETQCGDGAVEGDESCDDFNTSDNDGCSSSCALEAGYACDSPGMPCRATTCGDGKVEGLEQCDDGNTSAGDGCSGGCALEPGYACPTPNTPCRASVCGDGVTEGLEACDDGNLADNDGCSSSCTLDPFFECDGTSCFESVKFVRIAKFTAPMKQPQAVHYDPITRSFVAYGFDLDQGYQEVCLDGTLVDPAMRARPRGAVGQDLSGGWVTKDEADGLDGATYDPFNDRFLFVQQNGTLTEVDRATSTVVRTATLTGVGVAGGIAIGADGRLYVSNHYVMKIRVFERFGTVYVDSIDAPTDDGYLDNLFSVPSEGWMGYYNTPSGEAGNPRKFTFHQLDGSLVGRSLIPGTLFVDGEQFPKHADGGEAAPDGGFFLVCSEYLDQPSPGVGICQLFARTCRSNAECASRVPGTACKLDEPVPYCYAPAIARDDSYTVAVDSSDNVLDVMKNDTNSDAVCSGAPAAITATTPGSEGGTITIATDGTHLEYSPKPGFCGGIEEFDYTANLGGIDDTAHVSVLVACVCGDGTQQANEECDDGNTDPGDGCDALCKIESLCGDGNVTAGEECDDGNLDPGDGCSPRCTNELI